jgi:hypothetical protein
MNRIEYTLTADDLLQFNLYYSSISENHASQRRKHRTLVSIAYIILALISFGFNEYGIAIVFILFAGAWFLFSPRLVSRQYRKHYEKHIAETAGDKLPYSVVLELQPDGIFASSYMGEAKYHYDVVDKIVENEGYTYIFIRKDMAFILPHDRIPDETIKGFVDEIQRKKQENEQDMQRGDI